MKYKNIREEELKNKVAKDFFYNFDTTEIVGNIDFTILPKQESLFGRNPLLWAEAKTGDYDIVAMFAQLILTIGKSRTFDKITPPTFLGAFDFKKMAFVPYLAIQDIFYLNDFNWNVTSSNKKTKEFALIKERIQKSLKENSYVFNFLKDEKELQFFIKNNIANAKEGGKIKIDKNNFYPLYLKWLEYIKPQIAVDWDELKKSNILDCDFFLADLFVDDRNTQKIDDDTTIHNSLFVIFANQGYKISKENIGGMFDALIEIRDKQVYQNFWKNYKRPPIKNCQEYIIERRELLVPQDIRERKGAFFTPRQWVELSQKYLTDYLGENWQDDYYIWDCAAGTGNLLAGLTNKYHIFASTLDQADVNVMHERIDHGANLLKNHTFQFDFLNDEFIPKSRGGKIPDALFEIINDEEKRKKLVVYINPPYAEATTAKTVTGTGENKAGTAKNTKIAQQYKSLIGKASNELFAQFLVRIFLLLKNCVAAEFSKLKILQSSNFKQFRENLPVKLEKVFIVPADTFDNVKGKFPIGFKIWNTQKEEIFSEIEADVYDRKENFTGNKLISLDENFIKKWIFRHQSIKINSIGTLFYRGNDFQNQKYIYIKSGSTKAHDSELYITNTNIIPASIYFSVRHCIEATWLNDRDQFLYPNDKWFSDTEFQNDCLAFTLFHSQNRITSETGVNHWIPFTEAEVNAPEKFASHFMNDFINAKLSPQSTETQEHLFEKEASFNCIPKEPLQFSEEAKAVFDAGRELWKYYHKQPNSNTNASLYDIRAYFQGRNDKGKMNSKSPDAIYMELIGKLRQNLKCLAQKIEPKVYEYGFLKI